MRKGNHKAKRALTLPIILCICCLLAVLTVAGCRSEKDVLGQEDSKLDAIEIEEQQPPPVPEPEEDIPEGEVTGNINMLSGLEISGSVQNGRPLAIMVQNSPQARPQSGLIYADMVFEAVSEAGVTRFVALYSSHDAEIIGPARSARIYFAELARSFDPIFTFWGTYPGAYTAIQNMDMDVLDANSSAYVAHTTAGWRDPSRSNALEHTAFIDTYGIKEDAEDFGYSLQGGQSPMKFKYDAQEQERGNIEEISVDFSYAQYEAGFSYDREENLYYKYLAGEPHTDFETGEQISRNNVIVLISDIEGPISSAGHMEVRTTGEHEPGNAYYFMDGEVIEGSWGREDIFAPFSFLDHQGSPMLFNRGSTWVCIVESIDRLTY